MSTVKTIHRNTFITLEGLVLLSRRKRDELDALHTLQLDLLGSAVSLTERERELLSDNLSDATWDDDSDLETILMRRGIEVEAE